MKYLKNLKLMILMIIRIEIFDSSLNLITLMWDFHEILNWIIFFYFKLFLSHIFLEICYLKFKSGQMSSFFVYKLKTNFFLILKCENSCYIWYNMVI